MNWFEVYCFYFACLYLAFGLWIFKRTHKVVTLPSPDGTMNLHAERWYFGAPVVCVGCAMFLFFQILGALESPFVWDIVEFFGFTLLVIFYPPVLLFVSYFFVEDFIHYVVIWRVKMGPRNPVNFVFRGDAWCFRVRFLWSPDSRILYMKNWHDIFTPVYVIEPGSWKSEWNGKSYYILPGPINEELRKDDSGKDRYNRFDEEDLETLFKAYGVNPYDPEVAKEHASLVRFHSNAITFLGEELSMYVKRREQ